ncbi:MAG TPA: glycosyltransferase family 2 protein, partial [Firmicutes bacterium]|nr:glycosyltransferase family 2 protein [Bacillota bacterium]
MTDIIEHNPAPLVRVRKTRTTENAIAPKVSFAMPAYNEADNIERTVRECLDAFVSAGIETAPVRDSSDGKPWGEIVVTDDCSKDSTGEILERLQKLHPNIVIVTHLERNQGYGRALSDAIAASRGEWVATIDSDGQFDPAD